MSEGNGDKKIQSGRYQWCLAAILAFLAIVGVWGWLTIKGVEHAKELTGIIGGVINLVIGFYFGQRSQQKVVP